MDYQDILINAIGEAIASNKSLTITDIACAAGMQPSVLMRFYRREEDITAGNFFKVIEVLPSPQRSAARKQMRIAAGVSLKSLLEVAEPQELAAVLRVISDRYESMNNDPSKKANKNRPKTFRVKSSVLRFPFRKPRSF